MDKNTLLWWRVFSHIKNMIFLLWLPSYFKILTSIKCWFQIWSWKLSMGNILKVMMNLSSKFGKFKVDNIAVIWSENKVTKNTKDWWHFFSHIKNMVFHPKTSKIPKLQSNFCKTDLLVYFWENKWTRKYDISLLMDQKMRY